MTISVTNILQESSNTDGPYTTSSWNPSGSNTYLLSVMTRSGVSADPPVPSISGNGITWAQVASAVFDTTGASRKRLTLFSGHNSNPSAGTTTITVTGQVQTSAGWIIDQVALGNASTIVQSATAVDEGLGDATHSVTLGGFSNAANGTFGVHASDGTVTLSAVGTGFTKAGETTADGGAMRMVSEWRNDNDTTVDITWSAAGAQGGIAAELLNALPLFGPMFIGS